MAAKGVLMEPVQVPTIATELSGTRLVSVVVPVVERADDLVALYREFGAQLAARGERFEFLFVFDGGFEPSPALLALSREISDVHLLRFAQRFGETAALRLGIERSRGENVVDARQPRRADLDASGRRCRHGRSGGAPVDVANAARMSSV